MENSLLPAFASTTAKEPAGLADMQAFCPGAFSATGSVNAFAFGKCYTDNAKGKLAGFSAELEGLALNVGSIASITTYCQLLGSSLGFAITPCRYLGSTQGTLSLALTALTSAQIAMQAQAFLLDLAQQLLIFMLPLGVLLRTLRPTRGAGGAMIAIAVGFYFVYPLMVLVDYAVVKESAFAAGSRYSSPVFPPRMQSTIGTCTGDAEYIQGLVGKEGARNVARENFMEPVAYWVIIISILLPVMNLLVVLTFIRWFASLMGSEIEVSQLARVT